MICTMYMCFCLSCPQPLWAYCAHLLLAADVEQVGHAEHGVQCAGVPLVGRNLSAKHDLHDLPGSLHQILWEESERLEVYGE